MKGDDCCSNMRERTLERLAFFVAFSVHSLFIYGFGPHSSTVLQCLCFYLVVYIDCFAEMSRLCDDCSEPEFRTNSVLVGNGKRMIEEHETEHRWCAEIQQYRFMRWLGLV